MFLLRTPHRLSMLLLYEIPWSNEFVGETTNGQTFYKQDGKLTKVNMMHTFDQDKNFLGYEGKQYKVLDLSPCRTASLCMSFSLTKARNWMISSATLRIALSMT